MADFEAPKRIWARTGLYYEYVQDWSEGSWDTDKCEYEESVEYVRADLCAKPPKVKPLVWIECGDGSLHDPHYQYEIATDGGFWRVTKGVTGGGSHVCDCSTLEAAKTAAQADYARRILEALE
jgi:hypothetical protein